MIAFDSVTKRYGPHVAVDALTLDVAAGTFCVLIGPSGCGKSTTLRMVNALIRPDEGMVRVDGRDIRKVSAKELRRGIGYVIQSVGLFPHWSVADNIGTVPRLLRWPRERRRARTEELLQLVGLDGAGIAGKFPHQLSGGQQQRVGVARALAADPAILLMDEPFGALDPVTRRSLQDELKRIHAATGKTILFVTHDMDEALRLGNRILVLDQGRIVQDGSPRDILTSPANAFVTRFTGGPDAALRILNLDTAMTRMIDGEAPGEPLPGETPLGDVFARMLAEGSDRVPVRASNGRRGIVRLADLVQPPPT